MDMGSHHPCRSIDLQPMRRQRRDQRAGGEPVRRRRDGEAIIAVALARGAAAALGTFDCDFDTLGVS